MTGSGEHPPDDDVDDGPVPAWLGTYLTGLAMGTADAVPGVSGGTIALIAGIYDRLVAAIAAFEPRRLRTAVRERTTAPLVELFGEMDVPFLVALGLGMLTGVATVASAVEVLRQDHPAPMFAFFFGLIAASAVVLSGEVSLTRLRGRVAAVGGVVIAFALTGEGLQAAIGHGPVVVFLAGAVAISAMILPGISGSFILLMLGQYTFMTARLSAFLDALAGLATGGGSDALSTASVPVVLFLAGAGLGLLTFARVVEYALERDRRTTLTFLVALMVGALRLPAREVVVNVALDAPGITAVLGAALLGAGLVVALDHFTAGIGYETA